NERDVTASHSRILIQLRQALPSPAVVCAAARRGAGAPPAEAQRRTPASTKEGAAMKMYVAGQWNDKDQKIEVRNSYDNSVIDTVPRADRGDIERALQSAERGARAMAKLTSYERWKILHRAAELLAARVEELGTLISKEEGKILAEGRSEALRAVDTIMESAEEAKRVHGETLALTGSGGDIGDALVADRRVRKITFTGSRDVGEHICKTAGIKRVTMELGSNAPVIVMPDADLDRVAAAVASTGYANAGQVCISTQ